MKHVVVIGSGIAGLAAAWSAKRAGKRVTLLRGSPGASALASGAVDFEPWERSNSSRAAPLSDDARRFVDELGLWSVPSNEHAWVATLAGLARPARGLDRALLDLSRLDAGRILVPRAPRASWDADAIAAGLTADPYLERHGLTAIAIDAPVLRFDDEARIGDIDLAARHDHPERTAWLVERLRAALARSSGAVAVLVGPWLGASSQRAEEISKALGIQVGEALAGAGSPAGMRFEAARDRLLEALGVTARASRATGVVTRDGGIEISIEGATSPLRADAVVLAIGGLIGGGITYAPADHGAGADLPPGGRVPFALSLEIDLDFAIGDRPLGPTSSMFGPELDASAWPTGDAPGVLESVGVRCDGAHAHRSRLGGSAESPILVAGDARAGAPRTALAAIASGLVAGLEA